MDQRYTKHTRKFERFRAEQLGIDCNICGEDKGSLRNISIGGAGVCSGSAMEVGSKCVLGVNTPKGRFEILSEVVWTETSGSSICKGGRLPVSIGFRFAQDSVEQCKDLVFAILNSN